jgi:hypothetical protein
MQEYQLLETVTRRTQLGIRFWDPAMGEQIRSGLQAVLYPTINQRKKVIATRTRSGNYVFNGIPGMFDLETADSEDDSMTSPVDSKRYVLEVSDSLRRFSSVALQVELPLPYKGLFLVGDEDGSPSPTPRGFNLYSSINRRDASQFIFVRGDLIDRNTGKPAAHALVQVETEDALSWYGIADENGKFAVMMPYPYLSIAFGSSPPSSDGLRLFQRTWTLNINVFYEPLVQESLPDTALPDYSSVLKQAQALIYIESPETDVGEVAQMQADLVYGRDLIIKTIGYSELYVSPTGSPA